MSAVKVIFKRSSLLGKRPNGSNLEPGEIGLNTNSTDPGLFFEVNDGSVVKAGPTSYLPGPPTTTPSRGELWVDSDTKALNIGTETASWQTVSAPFLGGTNGLTVFVAPEYQNATDSLANDGQTVPFVTINRAILEVSKYIIQDTLNGISSGNNRYLIILAPGQHCVINGPGATVTNFTTDYSSPYTQVTQASLQQFNADVVGGLTLPRGVSIVGLDLKKCEVHPTYVPKYTHPSFPPNYQQQPTGPVFQNEPISSIFRWSGNTYLHNFVALDKVQNSLVVQTSAQEGTKFAIFKTERPHGLNYNDFVQIEYSFPADQLGASFLNGAYYVSPLNSYEFLASPTQWANSAVAAQPVLESALPTSYSTISINPSPKFTVSGIYPYYVPQDGVSYELYPYSHHRLSDSKNASVQQLNDYYTKVQKAFSAFFAGQVNTELASANPPEYEIVASTVGDYPNNLAANSTSNSSPCQNMVNVRSNYGMANGDFDGEIVSGFRSVEVNESAAVTLQKDPVAYELYSTSSQDWVQLTAFTQQTLGGTMPITSVPVEEQLKNLNSAAIPDIRYYYTSLQVIDPLTGNHKSTGIADPDNDFRHFGFRISGSNSYLKAESSYTVGAAIAAWAKNGATFSLTNSISNFGSVAFQAEGFAGIGTLGGANQVNKGFLLSGVIRPLALLEEAVLSNQQKRILGLGSKVVFVGPDPNDPTVQLVYLQQPFDPATILPFSLKPDTAVYVSSSGCDYRAFFVTDGSPTCILSGSNTQNPYSPGGAILRVRVSDSTIPNGSSAGLEIPYIRRFIDPRTPTEQSYGFFVQSTNPTSQAPQIGSVLRLNQTGQNLGNSLKRNYQFDPGQYGGIAQIFTVDAVETEQYALSVNFNYKIADATQATNYSVYTTLTDASNPWVQSVLQNGSYVPFYNPQGSYTVFNNKNYYAAENNSWTALYYSTTFNALNGPTKVTPDKSDSPFVVTSVIQKSELVANSWQGYVPDPFYAYYTNDVPAPYDVNLSYMRGSVIPYQQFGVQFQVDFDDSTDDLGIIYKRLPDPVNSSTLVLPSKVEQTAVAMTSPFVATPTFGRPEIIQLQLLSVSQVTLPKEGLSVLQLTNPALNALEYVRVVSLNSNVILAIRNYYPEYAQGTLPAIWPAGTTVKSCFSTGYPEPAMYDPAWGATKATMFRFFQLMGYAPNLVSQYLQPKPSGERILRNASIPLSPINGYANTTTAWPIEFNNPSSIIANTHTWQYVGYFDYSRGLLKYQVNEIPRKLSYDFLCTTAWGGRLTVTGVNEQGQLVLLGPLKEALTAKFFETTTPLAYSADRQIYSSPSPVTLPKPVLVYSTDDISGLFNGSATTFDLTRGGYPIPASQLSTVGVFVFLGGVVQKPGAAYSIQQSSSGPSIPRIVFTEAPLAGTSCDVRVVTSDDDSQSLEVVSFGLTPTFNGTQTSFTVSPNQTSLTNLNSFVFLGGVEQNPFGPAQGSAAYTIVPSGGANTLSFIGGAPLSGTVLDVRGILSGAPYRNAGLSSVFVSSVDDIAGGFNNTQRTFPLEIGGVPLDPTKVNAQNIFVSLGGVMQIPVAQAGSPSAGRAYSVAVNPVSKVLEITFDAPPTALTTCNIRVITSDEFLTCPLPPSFLDTALEEGPGITVNEKNQIIAIDPGLISP